ncbi:MAG: NTP transferase domain-containing protein, partial [Candidatus Thorarchaeota archaeon]|nr:NTP transferase domain-containing protein [Candidatus Thorarchaeota archaeon]NIW13414.1 NTP transferase domain-containing protein [Candidatus Thorarchaeota archaeon]NIW51515.1 NTP transferase domain-containing protein [Candidatus Korarchaeota archaeon]
MKAVVLAAGKGTRLRPLTSNRPKSLLPIGGAPLLSHLLNRLKEVGIKEVLIVTNFKEEMIREFYHQNPISNLSVNFIKQEREVGTADAFNTARRYVSEEFLGIYGDLFISHNVLDRVLKNHNKGENLICSVHVDNPSRYGVLKVENDKVVEIVEKPAPGEEPSNLANAGIYFLNDKIFEYVDETVPSEREEYEITDTLRAMVRKGEVIRNIEISRDEWLDVGLPWSLLEANERALSSESRRIEGLVEENVSLFGNIIISKGTRIRSGTYVEGPVFIDEESDIGPNCYIRPSSYIGKKTRIGNSCEIKNSIIMDESHVAHLSYIGDSIIGERCNLGAGTITANLRFDKKEIK